MHVIGTAGHVDHGKSALVERLTGIDPDRFAEEKRRGLTIDLGFAWLRLPSGAEVGIVDVPGHERFVRNMLAGAGGITICLFVVAANEGWMPQSSEHLAIVDVLGISAGVVALTKADTVDTETRALAAEEVRDRLAKVSLTGAAIVPCSATTGEGIDHLVADLDRVVTATEPAPDAGRPRLWVDRVFTIAGAGTVVTGTLAGGRFTTGDEVEIAPEGRRARIRSIQTHKKEVRELGPGNRCALNLAGLERQGAERGDAVVHPGRWRPTAAADVHIRVLRNHRTGETISLRDRGSHLAYVGSAETPVRLRLIGSNVLSSDDEGFARLHLRDPLPLARGDRFVIRDAGRILTVAGGVVLDPLPDRELRGGPTAATLAALVGSAPADALARLLESEGELEREVAELRTGAAADAATNFPVLGTRLLSPQRATEIAERARRTLASYHQEHPLERGMPRATLRAALDLPPEAFENIAEVVDGIVEEGPTVRLASHAVTLDDRQERARGEILELISAGGFSPPSEADLRVDPALLRALVDSGELVKIDGFYLTRANAAEARRRVREHIETSGPATVADIRDLLGTTRKYAVPLCEWLDGTGATRRRGDVRVLGPRA